MKKRFFNRKTVGIILVITGLIIISVAIGMRLYGEYKQKKMISAFENTIEDFDKQTNPKIVTKTTEEKEVQGAVGIMMIPKIDLKVAIGEGVDMETLKFAVGHFKGTAMPGEKGNFCVAGHRSYTYSEYFNRLDEVTVGDEISVKTKDKIYKYKVYEKKVVEPTEYSVLNTTKDAEITLVTCTPIRVATHRLIIKGKLIEN